MAARIECPHCGRSIRIDVLPGGKKSRAGEHQAVKEKLTGVDAKFGYEFGCEGLMTVDEACKMLSLTRWTIDKLHLEGKLRKGHITGGRVRICRRSVREYLATLEIAAEEWRQSSWDRRPAR